MEQNNKEDQSMEIEAMESIFMDDFKPINIEEGEYSIKVIPDPCGDNFVSVVLHVKYNEDYPQELPDLLLEEPYCLRGTDLADIYEIIEKTGNETMGMPMIFAISEAIREYLISINEPRNIEVSMHEQMMARKKNEEKKAALIEASQQMATTVQKVHGTPVTPEIFHAWFAKFMEEMGRLHKEDETQTKPTGKELFMTHAQELLENETKLEEGDEDVYEDEEEILHEMENRMKETDLVNEEENNNKESTEETTEN